MSGAKRIDYKKGLRSLLRINHPNRKLDAESTDLLVQVLNEINRQLVEQFDAEYEACPDKCFKLFAQKAVEKTFKGSLKKHAISEAARQLALFETGCMNYDLYAELEKIKTTRKEAKGKERREESKPSLSPEAAFRVGIGRLTQEGLVLERRAKHYLSQHLHNFTKMVGGRACELAKSKEELEPLELKKAAAEFLGPQVMKIANSEGSRSLVLYANGFLTFRPKQAAKKAKSKGKEANFQEEGLGKIFSRGIRRFLTEFPQDTSIHPKALKLVEDALFGVGNFLASYVADTCRENDGGEIGDDEVRECVQQVFPRLLKQHALIQGDADVCNFVQGVLKYKCHSSDVLPKMSKRSREKTLKPPCKRGNNRTASKNNRGSKRSSREPPKEPRSKKAKAIPGGPSETPATSHEPRVDLHSEVPSEKVKKKEMRLDFTSGLLDLCPGVFPSLEVSFQKDATKEIGRILNCVGHELSSKAGQKTISGSCLGIENIKDAVEDLFPCEMSHHAMSFASSVVMLNVSNISGNELDSANLR